MKFKKTAIKIHLLALNTFIKNAFNFKRIIKCREIYKNNFSNTINAVKLSMVYHIYQNDSCLDSKITSIFYTASNFT